MRPHSRLVQMVLATALATGVARAQTPDVDAHRLTMQGSGLSQKQVDALEAALNDKPDDIAARTQLLGCYFMSGGAQRQKHILWLIRHEPKAPVLGMPQGQLDGFFGGEAYAEGRRLWLEHAAKPDASMTVFAHAAGYLLLSDRAEVERLLKLAELREPTNPEWPSRLGQLYTLSRQSAFPAFSAVVRALKRSPQTQPTDSPARQAFDALVRALNRTPRAKRYYVLGNVAEAALAVDELKQATLYATELLTLAVETDANRDWNQGNAIHDGNRVLGLVALREGDVAGAERYLVKAGKTSGSPQLNSFGPDMQLAQDLLDKGRTESVVEYLSSCGKFWKRGQTDAWIAQIKRGNKPRLKD